MYERASRLQPKPSSDGRPERPIRRGQGVSNGRRRGGRRSLMKLNECRKKVPEKAHGCLVGFKTTLLPLDGSDQFEGCRHRRFIKIGMRRLAWEPSGCGAEFRSGQDNVAFDRAVGMPLLHLTRPHQDQSSGDQRDLLKVDGVEPGSVDRDQQHAERRPLGDGELSGSRPRYDRFVGQHLDR